MLRLFDWRWRDLVYSQQPFEVEEGTLLPRERMRSSDYVPFDWLAVAEIARPREPIAKHKAEGLHPMILRTSTYYIIFMAVFNASIDMRNIFKLSLFHTRNFRDNRSQWPSCKGIKEIRYDSEFFNIRKVNQYNNNPRYLGICM